MRTSIMRYTLYVSTYEANTGATHTGSVYVVYLDRSGEGTG
jgi:hypothetical protein